MGKYDATHSAADTETGNLSPIESHGLERLVNVSSSAGRWLGGLWAWHRGATGGHDRHWNCVHIEGKDLQALANMLVFRQPDAVSHVRV